ncbi:DNA primase [Hansschlegelia plantiphila]|uniref:DNA primase n=1 Tax=Hansschlegelia plantiphila TaxID=374655 RepID=A0A9W6MV12_9HYPH|nr:DNA primase [Hansschlegelia plantiphila]GLK67391.1 DNA primase [Hansschlegelia plantiphila]
MRFSPSFLDDLRQRLPVSEVVGRRVKLKRQGREYAGLSPFNAEKTPSFFVNDHKGFYHCFSSGKHGDVFKFLMEVEGVSFPEAVERIAEMAGVPMPKDTPEEARRHEARASLLEIMDMAARFYEGELQGRAGAAARAYLAGRALSPQTQTTFRIGYAPNSRTALRERLRAQGVAVADMVEAGLLVSGDDVSEPFDRFRDRIMFPIEDARGRVIAFGGRAMTADAPAKYLNSPETPLFHKGATLFNHHRARAAAQTTRSVVAVEGYVDAIALASAGVAHVVSNLGTALTSEQMELLWKMAPEPILCFDGDKAGRRAGFRAIETALPLLAPGRSLRFAFLPEGQDPDDLVRAEGRGAIDAVLVAAAPLVDVLWARELDAGPTDTPERAAAFETRIREALNAIRDETVRRHYQTAVASRLSQFGRPVFAERRSYGARGGPAPRGRRGGPERSWRNGAQAQPALAASADLKKSPTVVAGVGRLQAREVALALAVANHPTLLDELAEMFAELEFSSRDLDKLRRAILDSYAHGAHDRDAMRADLAAAGLDALVDRAQGALLSSEWWVSVDADPADAAVAWRHASALHIKVRALHRELRAAEQEFGRDFTDDNFRRIVEIQRQLSTAEGSEASIDGFGGASGRVVRPM